MMTKIFSAALFLALVFVAPWMLFNWTTRGDPLAMIVYVLRRLFLLVPVLVGVSLLSPAPDPVRLRTLTFAPGRATLPAAM